MYEDLCSSKKSTQSHQRPEPHQQLLLTLPMFLALYSEGRPPRYSFPSTSSVIASPTMVTEGDSWPSTVMTPFLLMYSVLTCKTETLVTSKESEETGAIVSSVTLAVDNLRDARKNGSEFYRDGDKSLSLTKVRNGHRKLVTDQKRSQSPGVGKRTASGSTGSLTP